MTQITKMKFKPKTRVKKLLNKKLELIRTYANTHKNNKLFNCNALRVVCQTFKDK